ncbi:putative membrane protein [Nitrosomonas sp. Nm84]|uniref:BPSS1780 family membrane protein n=1 Tax=Nitrosomonas sp. Nm84 TaxID=200124 RepID=UPI000D860DF1|nr:BPSS1780 family membrane protein [Nitrosomonas sp. Nm84]PXW89973.1 putative membrane protein [Nitrosomonas sp. Nm84]
MEIHQVNAKQGLQWILSGFYLFRKAPLAWIMVCFTLVLIAMSMSFIPLLGKFVFTLISPAFLAGIMLGCKDMEQGKPLEIAHLLAAFRTSPAPLITIGGVYLIGQILIIGLVMLIGGSQMTDMLLYGKRVDESELMGVMSNMLTSSLIALTLSIPLMMASWFSPLLVIFHNVPPIVAMQRSFFACLRNFIPFQIYGITLIVLTILCLMPYGIGLIVLIPVMFASIYVSYKDIFLAERLQFKYNQADQDYQKANWSNGDETSARSENETKPDAITTEDKPKDSSERDK